MLNDRGKLGEKNNKTKNGYTVICFVRDYKKQQQQSFHSESKSFRSFLLIYAKSPGKISHVCVCCVRVGLDLGRAGNFPWARGDGSLLAGGGPVAAGVLDATAWTSGVPFVQFFSWPIALTLLIFFVPLLSSTPPAQGGGVKVGPHPLRVHLGVGFLCRRFLLSPFALLVAFTGPPTFVPALCSLPLLTVSRILLLVPPVLPFSRGCARLLASWTPGTLGLLQVIQRHSRVMFPFGALPRAWGAVVSLPLGFSLLNHIFQRPTVASLCFSRALGALHMIRLAFIASSGTSRLGVTLACFSSLGAGAGGALLVVMRELLSSWSVSLPTLLLASARGPRCPGIPPRELIRRGHLRWRWGQFRGREGDRGWRGWRWLPVRCREPGKAWGWNGYFVFWT